MKTVESAPAAEPTEAPTRPPHGIERAPRRIVRPARLAGKWYPGTAEETKQELDGYLAAAAAQDDFAKPAGHLLGLVVPHAGYAYSGRTAASSYRLLGQARPKRVFVIGPSHSTDIRGVAVTAATHYATPLGELKIDTDAMDRLAQHPLFLEDKQADAREHSVEVQMPFIRHVAPDALVVPLIAGRLTLDEVDKIAQHIRDQLRDGDVVVASSDFTHYGPRYGYRPFAEDVPANLRKLDMEAFDHIAGGDLVPFWKFKHKTEDTICGFQPVSILMSIVGGGGSTSLIRYDTSGRVGGDFTNSVSYLAVALSHAQGWGARRTADGGGRRVEDYLGVEEQKVAVKIARQAIAHHFRSPGAILDPKAAGLFLRGRLEEPRGVFVTLKTRADGQLRGCIGDVRGRQPLYQNIVTQALNAAFHDRRFDPLDEEELDDVEVEVTVMTPLEQVGGPDDIVIGRDGIMLARGNQRALYLPQVAIEQGWGLRRTLLHLARKAGMNAGDLDSAEYWTFQGHVYHESHL